ncbi:MAG: DegQ family serine endoprotease [Thermodesulfobacteriota bacterium]
MTILTGLTFLFISSQSLAARLSSFADLVDKYGPTVVNIYTTQTVETPLHQFPFPEHSEIPEFFKHFFDYPDLNGKKRSRKHKRTSLGSGVIISKDGYIMTNHHVIENADEVHVRFADHRELNAEIIGTDKKSDLALIKIEPDEELPAVTFGNSDNLRVGDWVVAIGNPFGLEQTVTAGIVSGKGRTLGANSYENFIQTDASINPGNSGGPLFTPEGEMVGINTAIYSRTGGNIGIGFAVPVNNAKYVVEQLKEHHEVIRGWLGVMIQTVNQDIADQFGLQEPKGALVGEVVSGSPADKAGIKPGDIITCFNGHEIEEMRTLPNKVAQTPVGKDVQITVFRDGKEKKFSVTVGKLEDKELSREAETKTTEMGLSLQKLTPELAQSLNVDETEGIIITDVKRGSTGHLAGLRRGDIILEINRKEVKNLKDFSKAIEESGGSILMLIKRDDHTRFVVIRQN